jgi:hypothetical protein
MTMRCILTMVVLVCVGAQEAQSAETFSIHEVRELVTAASHARYGSPVVAILTIDGKPISFKISLDAVGNITALPQTDAPMRQISISVTTTNAGVVPSAVTLITAEGQVEGFSIATNKDGEITAVTNGGPVTIPTPAPPNAIVVKTPDGSHGQTGDQSSPPVRHIDIIDEWTVPGFGLQAAGAGIVFAPGTSPDSRNVSPHY